MTKFLPKGQILVNSETFLFSTNSEYPNLSTELWKVLVPVPVPKCRTSTSKENGQYRTEFLLYFKISRSSAFAYPGLAVMAAGLLQIGPGIDSQQEIKPLL